MSDRRLRRHWGELLRQARLNAGYTQAGLAREIDTHPEQLSRWECGIYAPREHFRPILAAALGVAVDDLFPYPPGADDPDTTNGADSDNATNGGEAAA